jgi:tetratricopeptide (TPR) repeat protein
LLKQSQQQRASGDLSAAADSLERALRIEPFNAWLWNRLAQLRLLQGRYAQAAALAGKSNALAGDSMRLREENQAIIAAVGEVGRP